MRISENRLFPHPVLWENNDNFVSSKFKIETEYRHDDIEYEFEFNVFLENKELENLIKTEKASIVCHLECAKTKFRKVQELNLGKNTVKLNVSDVDGRLELLGLIVANEDLTDYYSNDFDPDYGKNKFDIAKSSIMGIADIPAVFIENEKQNYSNLPSIFDISYTNESEFMNLSLNGDRIMIRLPYEEYSIRNAHKESLHSRNIMNAMIVFPALVGVLNDLAYKNSVVMYGNFRWFRVIDKKLKEFGCDLENGDLEDNRIFTLAHQLLGSLFSDAMDSLNYLEDTEQ